MESTELETKTNGTAIPKGIRDVIFKYRFESFLKSHGKPFSGDTVSRVEQQINDNPYLRSSLDEFVVQEVSNGKNRQVFLCDFSIESLKILGSTKNVRDRLASNGFNNTDFNNLLVDKDFENKELVYLNIVECMDGNPERITLSFINHETLENETDDGVVKVDNFIYIWIDIYPNHQYLQIKSRPYAGNNFMTINRSPNLFLHYYDLLKQVFDISFLDTTSE